MQTIIKKILVVDDEESITDIIKIMLSAKGYEVIIANNGKQGLDLYREKKPDLVITDIIMPDMEGIEFLKILKKENKNLPVIVMSGHPTGKQFLNISRFLGAHSYLQKPFSSSELITLIDNIENNTNQTV